METNDLIKIFNKYLVCYEPNEFGTGIKGIRSDAPKDAIDAYIRWFRNNHRYENGRMLSMDSQKIKEQIIDIVK